MWLFIWQFAAFIADFKKSVNVTLNVMHLISKHKRHKMS